MNHPNRNQRCPCGSGKKYKKCCATNNHNIAEKIINVANASSIKAAIELCRIEVSKKQSSEISLLLIFYLLKLNKYSKALKVLDELPGITKPFDVTEKILARLTNKSRFDLVIILYRKLSPEALTINITLFYIQAAIYLGEANEIRNVIQNLNENLKLDAYKYGVAKLALKAKLFDLAALVCENEIENGAQKTPAVFIDLSQAYMGLGDSTKAIDILDRGSVLFQSFDEINLNKVNLLIINGKLELAEALLASIENTKYRKDYFEAKFNLLSALSSAEKLIAFADKLIHENSTKEWARKIFFKVMSRVGSFEYLKEWHIQNPISVSYMATRMLYQRNENEINIYEAHLEAAKKFPNKCNSDVNFHKTRRLKIGYVSSDFKEHSVAYFIAPVIRSHDAGKYEIFAYYNDNVFDDFTDDIKSNVDGWRVISYSDTEAVVELIRNDEIDILIDLNGHTNGNRLDVFANRVAPVQATWIGYPATTGFKTIDYRFVDSVTDEDIAQNKYYTEELIKLNTGVFEVYEPPNCSPKVSASPCISNDFVTFGSFNNHLKVDDEMLVVWAKVLQKVPRSQIIIKNSALSFDENKSRILNIFSAHGVAPNRVNLISRTSSVVEHFEIISSVDIAFDSYPYSGATTTCECLWMGVPVITMYGTSHRSRVSFSFLRSLGLTELCAETSEGYEANAIELAADNERLLGLRSSLRKMMSESALMDYSNFTNSFEHTLSELYARNVN